MTSRMGSGWIVLVRLTLWAGALAGVALGIGYARYRGY